MTSRLEPRLDSGSLLDFYSALWGPYYAAVLSILGPTGIILPIGDPRHGQPSATSFTTMGGERLAFTWSKAPNSFDTPLDLTQRSTFQGIVPFVRPDGVDEEADTPDADYWTRGDGSNDGPFSIVSTVNPADAPNSVILAKWDAAAGSREWMAGLDGSGRPQFLLYDESANAQIGRRDATALVENVVSLLVFTCSGNGASSGLKIYLDRVQVDDTDVESGAYTAMENLGTVVTLGHQDPSSKTNFFNGRLYGGPLGMCIVHKELSEDEVAGLGEIHRRALAY